VPWFKVDDGFHGHPKVMDLSLAAVGLWTLAGTWCAQYLTDGEIHMKAIQRLGGAKKQARELVNAGLWVEKNSETYQFCGWDEYQPTKTDVEAERAKARERMRENRQKRKGTAKTETAESSEEPEDVRANTPRTDEERSPEQDANDVGTFGGTSEDVRITPTLSPSLSPVPLPTKEREPRKRATRISEDFTVTDGMRNWATSKQPHVDIDLETEKFINFWISKSGKDATKVDWPATWRNWILNSRPTQQAAPSGGSGALARLSAYDAQQPRLATGTARAMNTLNLAAQLAQEEENQDVAF